jgi:phosphopantetheinyl transferase (holo-ACP synthase)
MIYGIGTDICDVRRIRASLERHGERCAEDWRGRAGRVAPAQRPLARARPALSGHALFGQGGVQQGRGPGHAPAHDWRRCEIGNAPGGAPCIVLHGELKTWFEAQGLRVHNLSDESDYAVSFCVVERLA